MQSKKYFMLKKLITDLKRNYAFYPISNELSSNILGQYYFVFDEQRLNQGKDQSLISKFDHNGIPINSTYIDVSNKEYVYYPISIGQLGLAVYHTFLHSTSDIDKNRFMKYVKWYYDNAEITDELGARWLTDVPLPQYSKYDAWQSAFSQSRAISILLRGYQLTNDHKYSKLAEMALIPFSVDVNRGGVTSKTRWGKFYEEYTSNKPILVLNGHIFSLFGLIDFTRVFTENEEARNLVQEGVKTLINCLNDFDLGYWSRYNYCQLSDYPNIDPSTMGYQRLHIMQLIVINRIFPNKKFDYYIRKWSNQIKTPNYLRSLFQKYKSLKALNRI